MRPYGLILTTGCGMMPYSSNYLEHFLLYFPLVVVLLIPCKIDHKYIVLRYGFTDV